MASGLAPVSLEEISSRHDLLELAAKHSKALAYNLVFKAETEFRGKHAPLPYGIPEIPEKILVPELLEQFVTSWLRPNVEIEMRLGRLLDKSSGEKARLSPRVKSILLWPPLIPRCRFEPGIPYRMFSALNREMNKWVKTGKGSIRYNRTLAARYGMVSFNLAEIDRVHYIKNSNVGTSQHIRCLIDPIGKETGSIVKQRLQNLVMMVLADADDDPNHPCFRMI
eukprot:jgi/Bigna1/127386/aug1.4_g2094